MGIINKLFGIPKVGSEHGEMVDHMLELVHWVMLVLFVGWSIYLTITLLRFYRKRNPRADYTGVRGHASSHIEIGVIITEIILLLGFAFPLWATQVDRFPDPDVRINAWAQQFGWNFHYPGPDGKFGITNRFMITADNPIGIDPEDPNSLDDFVSGDLVIPKGKKIEIAVTSKDVIHNLALVGMRTSTDADPGKVNRIWFIPIMSGKSEVICGQLCGPGHANMKAFLDVKETVSAFESWQKEQSPVRDKGFAAEVVKKLAASSPAPVVTPAPAPANTAPAPPAPAPAAGAAVKLQLGVIPGQMKYDKTSLTVKAGQPVELLFENKGDPQPHNFVLLKPGTRDAYGALSEKLILADPTGAAAQLYAPASPDVLAKGSKLIGISQTELIKFTAPSVPGDYPYICTFPAHWRLMNGVLKVTP
jgi:cytochrome c oxidase subunit 2